MRRLNNRHRAAIRGLMMGCFGISLFMFVTVMTAFGAGTVGVDLPILTLGSALLCLYGWYTNGHDPNEENENGPES